MRVICINNNDYPISLTLNKEYIVVYQEEFFYSLLDDSLEEYIFPKNLFLVVENNRD
jgi:hypothetical protein